MITGTKANRFEDVGSLSEDGVEVPLEWDEEFWDVFCPDEEDPMPEPDDFWIEPAEDFKTSFLEASEKTR